MKLKLLFFMGILSVLFNTMNGQNTAPSFLLVPPDVTTCPGLTAANVLFRITDTNTDAANLVVTAVATTGPGIQTVNILLIDETGTNRRITTIPTGPILEGPVPITVTITDDNPILPLSTSYTFTVTFDDSVAPTISTPADRDVFINSTDCNFSIPNYTGVDTVTTSDACGVSTVTQSPLEGTILSNDGTTQIITLTADDGFGNTASSSFTITLQDDTLPTVLTKDKTVQLDALGNATVTTVDIDNGSSDNCGIASMSVSPSSFACSNIGNNTVTLTVTDTAGNVSTNTATVTVEDVIAPTLTCAAGITVGNDSGLCSANVTIPVLPINGSGGGSTNVLVLGSPTNASWINEVQSKLIATAAFSSVDTFNLGTGTPTVPFLSNYNAVLVFTDGGSADAVTAGNNLATYIDNGGGVLSMTFDIASAPIQGAFNTNAYRCILPAGQTQGSVQTLGTVYDGAHPIMTGVTSFNGGSSSYRGNSNALAPGAVRIADWSDGLPLVAARVNVGPANARRADLNFYPPSSDSRSDFWDTATDGVKLMKNALLWVASAGPGATDNCSVVSVTNDRTGTNDASGVYPVGTTTITWTAKDASNNTSTCTQTVTVNDTQAPTVLTQNKTVYLDEFGNASITTADIDNGSTDNCGTIVSLLLDTTSFTCANLGSNTVTLTATDNSGNVGTGTATVTVVDNIAPIITTIGDQVLDNTPGQCGRFIPTGTSAGLTITDNCTSSGAITVTRVRSDGLSRFNPFPVGVTTITWTATDASGNMSTASITVTVNDVEPPTFTSSFPDIVVPNDPGNCSYLASQLIPLVNPSVTDNCTPFSGVITISSVNGVVGATTIPVSVGPDHIPSIVTWTATDNANNTVTATQNVTVQDLELPVMRTKNITKYYDANGQIIITPEDIDNGSTDNSGTDCFTKYVVPNILYCGDKGDNSVILTGTDAWGNQHYKEATVTAVDNTNPTFVNPELPNIVLNTNTDCTWVGVLPIPATADNCTVVTVTNDAPAALPLGDTTVTWTVTDASGNTASTTQLVTVNDIEKPVAIAKLGVVVTLDPAGEATITAIDIDNGSTDNCGIDSMTVSPNNFDCDNVGANVVTLTVTDDSGNVSTIDTVVTVQDTTAPTVVTVDYTAQLDATGTVTITTANVNNGSSDSCGIKTITVSPSTFTCANVGANTVTLTVTDNNSNVSTGTAIVTVVDSVLPVVVTKSFTAQLDATGNVTITAADVNNGSSDSCGIKTISVSPSSFTCANAGANTVTLTVTDNNDNVSTGTAIVTVVDSVLPVVITKPITVQLDASGSATIVASDVDNGSTDNCAIASYTLSKSTFTCSDIGVTTITLKATDTSGNVSLPVNALVTVQDVTAPTVNTKNITVQLNAAGIASIVPADVNNVSTDACGIASYSLDKTTFNCSNVGANTVTLTVIDINGNSSSATATVTVQDTVKPIALTRNITVQLNAAGTVSILPSDIDNGSTDNCAIVSYALSKSTFDCTNVGSNTIQLTATDAAGNVSLPVNATVIVQDKVVPTVITKNITVQLNSAGTVTIAAADVNNGSSDICGAVTLAISKSTFTCANVGANVITLTVTDVNGNINQGFATVTVVDSIIPVITSNGNKTANADLGECSAIVTVSATATDNCTVGSPIGVRSDAKPLAAAYPVGTTTITWNVTDTNGNAAVAVTQTVTVTDTQKPVITTNGDKLFVNSDAGQCGALVLVSATATDNCSVGTPTGVRYFNGSLTPDGLPVTAPYAVGTTIIKWNVTDANTNTAVEVSQKVVVKDIQIPVINGTIATINANTDATVCAATVSVTAPTASDNCTVGAPIGTRSDNLALNALYPIGTTTITWNVTDINGNVALPTTTTVKVKDVTAPTVITKNITIQLNVAGTASIVAADVNNGSTDGCGIASYSIDRTSFSCSDTGAAKTVTLTVIDIYGNKGTGTAQVTVVDPILPIAFTRNITVQLNAAGTVSILPSDINNGSTDNCSIASYTLSKSTFNCSNVGQNIITLTATDASGNNSIPVNATVIVQDVTAPVVLTKTFTAQLDSEGSVTITPADVNNGSSDSCGIATYAISKSTFTCANVGENIITLTATDVNGNVNQAFAKVIVEDKVAPVIVTKNIELVLDHGSVTIVPEDVLVSATDACGVDVHSYTLSKDTFTIVDVLASPVTITVYATDVNGNVGSATATVTFPLTPSNAAEAITPNGDGINDTWVISNITNHTKSIVRVYNRWGSMVFSALNYQNDWDGKLNGSDATLPDGQAYYYQVDLEGTGSVDKEGWLYIKK